MQRAWSTLYFVFAAILGGFVGIIANLRILLMEKFKRRMTPRREAFLQDKWRTMNFYKILSKIYDIINPAFYDEAMRRRIVDSANFSRNALVLDVGCGTGYTTKGILKKLGKNGSIVAVDLTLEQMRKAIKNLKSTRKVEFLRADAENLPFRERIFDAAISAGAIEYFPNPDKAIKELARVVKNGGGTVIAGPERKWFNKARISRSLYSPPVKEVEEYYRNAGLKSIESFLIGPKTYLKTIEYVFVVVGEVFER